MSGELHLTKKDFKLEWYSGSGAGGQHRNKHQNCCRITHIETGITCNGTGSRDRVSNQREAFTALAKRILSYYSVPKERRDTFERVRNYHAVRNEVLDHASGIRKTYTGVIDGNDIAELIEARALAIRADEL